VATREENGGKSVRVTAAIEDDRPVPSSKERHIAFELGHGGLPAEDDDWLQYDDEQDRDDNLTEAIIDVLLKHAVPEDVMDQIVSCASLMDLDEPMIAFVGALDALFNFTPLPTRAYKKSIMFVGPSRVWQNLDRCQTGRSRCDERFICCRHYHRCGAGWWG
jgi:flagellar biosynthesis protein FlhF